MRIAVILAALACTKRAKRCGEGLTAREESHCFSAHVTATSHRMWFTPAHANENVTCSPVLALVRLHIADIAEALHTHNQT